MTRTSTLLADDDWGVFACDEVKMQQDIELIRSQLVR